MVMLRKPPAKNGQGQNLLQEATVRYTNYTNEDSPIEDLHPNALVKDGTANAVNKPIDPQNIWVP